MVCRCVLGQGGGPAYLRELGQLHDFEDLVERNVARQRSVLATWALNLPVVRENLAEPTRAIPS